MQTDKILKPLLSTFQQDFKKLVQALESGGLYADSFRNFLGGLKQAVNQLGAEALVQTVQSFDRQDAVLVQDGKIFRRKIQSNGDWLTPFGLVKIQRHLYQADRGGPCRIPLDERCGMSGKYMTPDVEEASVYGTGLMTPGEVNKIMAKLLPAAPSETAIRAATDAVCHHLETKREVLAQRIQENNPLPTDGEVLSASWDGVMTPLREPGKKAGRKAKRPGVRDSESSPTAWKEAGVGSVSVYRYLDGAMDKLERVDTRYVARMPESGMVRMRRELSEIVEAALSRHDYMGRVLICDGKREIWKAAEQMPVFDSFIFVLDFYHATEALSKAAEAIFGAKSPKGTQWYQENRLILRDVKGGVDKVIRSMHYHKDKLRADSARWKEVNRVIRFFGRNKDKMDYANWKEMGYPIGSGVVEAACKTVVGQRLKKSGMRWSMEGGQKILDIRSQILSNQWETCWNYYLEAS